MDSFLQWIVLLYGASALVLCAMTILAWRNRAHPAGWPMAVVTFLAAMWTLSYNVELRATDLASLWFWRAFKNIFIAFLPVAVAVFILRFTGRHDWPSRRFLAWLLVIPCITVTLVFTNPVHELFWVLDTSPGAAYGAFERGPWFWFHILFSYSIIFCSLVVGLLGMSTIWVFYRRELAYLLIGLLFPLMVNAYGVLGFQPKPPVDLSPLAFGVSVLMLFLITRGNNLFNIVPFVYELLVFQMRDGVILLDQHGKVVQVNRAAERLLGMTKDQILGRMASDIDHMAFHVLNLQATAGATFVFEVKLGTKEDPRWYDVSLTTLTSSSRDVMGRMTIWRDITERKLSEQKLRYLSTHDQLTGLYNRLYYDTEFERIGRGRNWPVTVMMIDLDHMKLTNDQYGHQMGDELLKRAAQILKDCFRADDVLARVGGDEFAGLLPGCGENEARKLAARIERMLEKQAKEDGRLPVRFSLGWAVANDAEEMQDAIRQADLRMYAVKKEHKRNRVD